MRFVAGARQVMILVMVGVAGLSCGPSGASDSSIWRPDPNESKWNESADLGPCAKCGPDEYCLLASEGEGLYFCGGMCVSKPKGCQDPCKCNLCEDSGDCYVYKGVTVVEYDLSDGEPNCVCTTCVSECTTSE